MTERLTPDQIDRAAQILRDGGLVAFPTETVYGLGADATNADAVARIYAAKGRPAFNPLIVHVPDTDAAERLVAFDARAQALADAFWPGPMTLVLPIHNDAPVASLTTAGLPTLAVRVPATPLARALLSAVDRPIAAPSANPSGRVSPTMAEHVMAGLGGRIEAVLDGGACGVGVESTILMPVADGVRLLRPGGLATEEIETLLGDPLLPADDSAITAPGQLASHYAPAGRVRLNVTTPEQEEVLLGFGPVDAALNLSETGDLQQAAARLFDCLQQLDSMQVQRIAVSPIPDHGLGRAINDRLRRAAAPR
ncbi:Threonylcarbamoyl-AMP synthase [Rhodobacteraceae bacterium THAF1]|uniref:L-threonylcarbamoyladenylate synthase n=1 Tax=Palleronia sp. THAF1 TaxID=2587842 RepID=UPI000F408DE7|nr:L-threonylcarbamoyladenylate synthase [Palleronia sp. THAF1]QFU09836.1 Threonylcarbamoyl-AMP synthase [Palleronia sp. THAF1]VDC17261.1 Threonylcarbamoyl-AMP synthase [Rhodobacteraceae bacterium THAF1]